VLPGVVELLQRLATDDNATLGIGTGNFRVSAGIKLRHFGIGGYFHCGGFGDKSAARADVIAAAIRSGNRLAGRHDTIFVIGDTAHDIHAALANNTIAVGVATGTVSEAELAAAGAHYVYPTLESADVLLPARVP
jgi:phosphoglycolate phosphatase-like HAD superfamily hydrolase